MKWNEAPLASDIRVPDTPVATNPDEVDGSGRPLAPVVQIADRYETVQAQTNKPMRWNQAPTAEQLAPPLTWAQTFQGMLKGHEESDLLNRQRVSPGVFASKYPPQPLGELEEWDTGPAYRVDGQIRAINPETDFIATDPRTGKKTVYARHGKELGNEAYELTNQGILLPAAREITGGLVTNPIGGIQRIQGGSRLFSGTTEAEHQAAIAAEAARARAAAPGAGGAGAVPPGGTVPPGGANLPVPAGGGTPARQPTTGTYLGTQTGAATATQRAQQATEDLQAFDDLGVRKFGPAFNQGPMASVAKQLTETPIIGSPLRNALEESLADTARAAQNVAGNYGTAATAESAGARVATGLERFKDARPDDVVARQVGRYSPDQLNDIITAPARETSLKTKQAALYQRAWDYIPVEMQQGRAVEGLPRVLGDMPETRQLLIDIRDRNLRMIQQTEGGQRSAAAERAAAPVATSGLAGRMVQAMMNTRWRAALQTMRDIRSDFRRMASGIGDTEANTLRLSDLDRMQSTITRDMIALLERNVADYRAIGRTAEADNMQRAIHQFRRADQFTRASMRRMEYIERLFNAPSSEAVYRGIASAALSGGRGDMERLRILSRVLRRDEMGDLASGIIHELGRPAGSVRGAAEEFGFSVNSFLTRVNNMTPEARHILFGGEHARAFGQLTRVVRRLANVEAQVNTSRSGTNILNLGGALTGGGLLASGQWLPALGVLGTGVLGSAIMSRPAYARWAAGYARARAAALRSPINQSGGRLQASIQQLGTMAAADPALIPVFRAVTQDNQQQEQPPKPQVKPKRDERRASIRFPTRAASQALNKMMEAG